MGECVVREFGGLRGGIEHRRLSCRSGDVKWYGKGCAGSAKAMYNIMLFYANYQGVVQHLGEAARWQAKVMPAGIGDHDLRNRVFCKERSGCCGSFG
jgi:TPR repeat protein